MYISRRGFEQKSFFKLCAFFGHFIIQSRSQFTILLVLHTRTQQINSNVRQQQIQPQPQQQDGNKESKGMFWGCSHLRRPKIIRFFLLRDFFNSPTRRHSIFCTSHISIFFTGFWLWRRIRRHPFGVLIFKERISPQNCVHLPHLEGER